MRGKVARPSEAGVKSQIRLRGGGDTQALHGAGPAVDQTACYPSPEFSLTARADAKDSAPPLERAQELEQATNQLNHWPGQASKLPSTQTTRHAQPPESTAPTAQHTHQDTVFGSVAQLAEGSSESPRAQDLRAHQNTTADHTPHSTAQHALAAQTAAPAPEHATTPEATQLEDGHPPQHRRTNKHKLRGGGKAKSEARAQR